MGFFKKIANLFKSKKFVTWFAVGVSVIVVASSTLGVMLTSYNDWKTYYDNVMSEREYQKYLQSRPLELVGISADVAAGVAYYDNGKADPQKSDFSVMATFTEKGKEFGTLLTAADFEIDVPQDFAQSGGVITVTYAFTPEVKEGEPEKEPTVKSAQIDYALVAVEPVAITVNDLPYRVTYVEGSTFEKDGMTATLRYNDGSTEIISDKDVTANSKTLSASDTAIDATWARGDKKFDFKIPVRVMTADTYGEGDILALKTEGEVYIDEGELTSTAMPAVRATYENGNRLLLTTDQCEVSGNVDRASFTKACVLTVKLKNNPSIVYRTIATVRSGYEAEDTALTGVSGSEVDEYEYDGIDLTMTGTAEVIAPANGNTASFDLSSESISKPDISLRYAMKPGESAVKLSDVVSLTVNGKAVAIPEDIMLEPAVGAQDKYVFAYASIPSVMLLKSDENKAVFTFKSGAEKIVIDRFALESAYKGEFFATTEEYLVEKAGQQDVPFDNTLVRSWNILENVEGMAENANEMNYAFGICSDGTYLYSAWTTWRPNLREVAIEKFDPKTNRTVAVSKATPMASSEEFAGITYYDGKVIVFMNDGSQYYAETSSFVQGCELKPYDGFNFERLQGKPIKDVYYNTVKQKFAVYTEGTVYIIDKDMKTMDARISGVNASRVTGSIDYIYCNAVAQDGVYSPVVSVYDWSGNAKGTVTIPVSPEFMTSTGIVNLGGTKVFGLAVVHGDFYVTMLCFRQNGAAVSDGAAYIKVSMPPVSEDLNDSMTFAEYVDVFKQYGTTFDEYAQACEKFGKTANIVEYVDISIASGKTITLDDCVTICNDNGLRLTFADGMAVCEKLGMTMDFDTCLEVAESLNIRLTAIDYADLVFEYDIDMDLDRLLAACDENGIAVTALEYIDIAAKFGQSVDYAAVAEFCAAREIELTFGLKTAVCEKLGISASYTSKPSTGELGSVTGVGQMGMGAASDGKYLYCASKWGGDNSTCVGKVNTETWQAEAISANMSLPRRGGDHARMFIKDGKLYLISGDVYSIAIADFADGCTFVKDEEMTALLTGNTGFAGSIKSAAWNETRERFVVMNYSNEMYLLDGQGAVCGDKIALDAGSASLCCDDGYIYVSQLGTGQSTLPIVIYDWDGNKLWRKDVEGIKVADRQYNIQAIYIHNGQMHASLCTWSTDPVFHDFTVEINI